MKIYLLTPQDQRLIETVRTLDEISLNHTIEFSPPVASAFFHQVYDGYGDLVDAITDLIPKAKFNDVDGKPNPNNGMEHHRFRIGVEGSRVIYVDVAHAYLKGDIEAQITQLDASFNALAKKYEADELNKKSTTGSTTWRFWWD